MKRKFLIFLMTVIFCLAGMNLVKGQDQPKPKKDTVNIDTDAKPQFYYAEEEEETGKKSNTAAIVGAGAVVVIAAGYLFTRKKK
jgi:LPXTG-motif cell wall-anchored protein